jgi:hypothetical protein
VLQQGKYSGKRLLRRGRVVDRNRAESVERIKQKRGAAAHAVEPASRQRTRKTEPSRDRSVMEAWRASAAAKDRSADSAATGQVGPALG